MGWNQLSGMLLKHNVFIKAKPEYVAIKYPWMAFAVPKPKGFSFQWRHTSIQSRQGRFEMPKFSQAVQEIYRYFCGTKTQPDKSTTLIFQEDFFNVCEIAIIQILYQWALY